MPTLHTYRTYLPTLLRVSYCLVARNTLRNRAGMSPIKGYATQELILVFLQELRECFNQE